MALVELPVVVAAKPGRPELGGVAHPMRVMTRELAFVPDAWTSERQEQVANLFASLAPEWSSRDLPERHDALRDAVHRGGPFPPGPCLEVGAGTGSETPDLQEVFATVISTDFSLEMLQHFQAATPTLQADGAHLPVPD